MADYKSMIKGTINAIGTKAKDFAESGKMRDAYDRGSTTARCYAAIAKLNVKINGEVEEQKKIFMLKYLKILINLYKSSLEKPKHNKTN